MLLLNFCDIILNIPCSVNRDTTKNEPLYTGFLQKDEPLCAAWAQKDVSAHYEIRCLHPTATPTHRKKRKRWKSLSTTPTRTFPRIKVTPLQETTDIVPNLDSRRKWVSRENLKNLRPHPASFGDRPRETMDFIGSNCISGAGKQKSGIEELSAEIWRCPFFARTSPPPPAARRVLQGGRCAVEHIRRKSVRFWG